MPKLTAMLEGDGGDQEVRGRDGLPSPVKIEAHAGRHLGHFPGEIHSVVAGKILAEASYSSELAAT